MKPTPAQDTQRAIGLFGNPSKSFLAANAVIPDEELYRLYKQTCSTRLVGFEEFKRNYARTAKRSGEKPARNLDAPNLNKTEQRWQDAHPSHISFPMSLRWGKCMSYKPDFMDANQPLMKLGKPILIEVKGAHIYDRDIVRFKGCAAEWGWLFSFEMWQWKDSKWTRLY